MSVAIFPDKPIVVIGAKELRDLKEAAREADLRRARICLHRTHDDPIQEMIIALCRDSYIRPHRHIHKTESIHVMEGELLILFFDDEGEVTRKIRMGPGKPERCAIYRLSTDTWHTVIPITEMAVFHETVNGPFDRANTQYPAWAPEENSPSQIQLFIERITAE